MPRSTRKSRYFIKNASPPSRCRPTDPPVAPKATVSAAVLPRSRLWTFIRLGETFRKRPHRPEPSGVCVDAGHAIPPPQYVAPHRDRSTRWERKQALSNSSRLPGRWTVLPSWPGDYETLAGTHRALRGGSVSHEYLCAAGSHDGTDTRLRRRRGTVQGRRRSYRHRRRGERDGLRRRFHHR